ncbi:MAG: hypothetical protein PHI84_20250 [Kiritimatiellae bacterium]|nr:hypothetical protein [Kiritimatiellia bacterium]
MNTKTIKTISITTLSLYIALFIGLPAIAFVVLFVGIAITGDAGGPMFIPIVLFFAGIYFAVAVAIGIVLAIIAVFVWSRVKRKEQRI